MKIPFDRSPVSVMTNHPQRHLDVGTPTNFHLFMSCKQFDWQMDSVALIGGILQSALAAHYKDLEPGSDEQVTPTEW